MTTAATGAGVMMVTTETTTDMVETTTMDVVAETTTELPPVPSDARPQRSGVSVRVRLTATVALLVALALAGAGLIVYLIEAQRIEDQTASEIDQEFAEFSTLVDPGEPKPAPALSFTSPEAALTEFLSRNVPDDTELLVGWWDDGSKIYSPQDQEELIESAAFDDALRSQIATNGTTTIPTDDGDLLLTVQSVQIGGQTGALVVGAFVDQTREGLGETMRTYSIVAALSLLLITALAAWQSGRLLAPLRTLRETADEITDTDLSRRLPVSGNDDITALTRTVNGMLDRLEAAFVGQRQFLDDAGHELKTPLTVLRGHLELLDTGSPDEVAETRALLLDEVDRMARLVGDLILLAKSDRPDFVTTRPVDLAGLTADVLAKARGLADRTWPLDGAANVTVPLDEQRITQALLQLCDNAVKHTRAGDEIAIGSSYDARGVRLWVRDTGPGVPAPDRDQIFDRFGRGPVAERDEGFGLGLSIVRAIAAAHGGTVQVEDAEPPGARFVITLPVGPSPDEELVWPAS
jgi:two-component system OmpR family sensor kinase